MSVYHKDTRQKIKIKDKSRAKDKRQKEKDKRKPYLDFWTIEPSMFLSSPDSLIR